jgi:hypothetical protein
MDAVRLLQSKDHRYVGMVQCSKHPRFAFKTGKPIAIVRERFRQNFDRYVAPEFIIASFVHFSHAARTDGRKNFIGA